MFDEPIFFKPIMIERVWGGNNLDTLHGKAIPAGKIIGESWELSDRPEAQSVVDGGEFDGWTLRQLIEKYPREMLGEMPPRTRFPLLVKYVDAGDKLSVQVHPDDDGATVFDDLGKTECWVVVHAEPGAQLVRGLKPGTTREVFARAVEEDKVETLLHYFQPKVGDVIALPPGTVHAIGKGLVVAEVQQNSDVTLRIYDYKRMGLDGRPRKLHVKEALDSIRFGPPGNEFEGDMTRDVVTPLKAHDHEMGRTEILLQGKYFDLMRLTVLESEWEKTPEHTTSKAWVSLEFDPPGLAKVIMVLEGSGEINGYEVKAGTTGLIPAAMKELCPNPSGKMTLLLATPK